MRQAHCWLLIGNVPDFTLETGRELEARGCRDGLKIIEVSLHIFEMKEGIIHVSNVQGWDTTLAQ